MAKICKQDVVRFVKNDPRLTEYTYCCGVDKKTTCLECKELITVGVY